MSLDDDLVDLARHRKEAPLRRSFNYAVISPDESRVLGCVYVDPPERQGADADVTLWVRVDEEGPGLEEALGRAVREWVAAEWPFERARWPGREISWEEWDRLPEAWAAASATRSITPGASPAPVATGRDDRGALRTEDDPRLT